MAGLDLMERIGWREDIARLQNLTQMERLVCVCVWMEQDDKSIQTTLGLNRSTVHGHVTSIARKLHKTNRTGIALTFERALHSAPIKASPWRVGLHRLKALA